MLYLHGQTLGSKEQYCSNEVSVKKNINYPDQPNIPLRPIAINFITATQVNFFR